ncbi:hypothetical protein VMCG_03347 [Cytospora schulzeri]|uniref:Arylsulfatase n=1 Tax=Cytospora schulzeri TaxID=448051 RepID=A0A423WW21_9PEZI|nr:hypothetical protein VMCG_03347 [Valsa malicola]
MHFPGVIAASTLVGAVLGAGLDDVLLGQQNVLGPSSKPASTKKPNIIFVLTDDQDLHMDSLDYMPHLKEHLIDKGTLFKRHFCTTAICCPARVSLWTGMLAHNTNVTDVNPPYGGYPKFLSQGLNENYLPVWLQDAGYNTYYTGKLFNAHTVDNYNSPHAAGWTQSDFVLDPYTYDYLNASYQRNHDPPISYEGQNTMDVLTTKAYGMLDDAVKGDKPFFLGLAPVAPHSNVRRRNDEEFNHPGSISGFIFSPPIPAQRHEHLFEDAQVPRKPNFNPDQPSGANWVREREQLTRENVEFNDYFYRQRLRALQSVDELVEGVFEKLEEYGLLDNTYVFYTTDNGYHISQHRLQPGKECSFEEDINIPLVIRGPGVPEGEVSQIVTTHTDLAPTILSLVGAPLRASFDGEPVPLTKDGLEGAIKTRSEHVTVEYWGIAAFEGAIEFTPDRLIVNNTYKAVRVISEQYNLLYSTDPYQMHNLLHPDEAAFAPSRLLGVPISKVIDRLDSLLFVLKSCKGHTCVRPWQALHPNGNVQTLKDALSPRFDAFYTYQTRVEYDHCEMGYIPEAEGAQFEKDGYVYRQGTPWHEWV